MEVVKFGVKLRPELIIVQDIWGKPMPFLVTSGIERKKCCIYLFTGSGLPRLDETASTACMTTWAAYELPFTMPQVAAASAEPTCSYCPLPVLGSTVLFGCYVQKERPDREAVQKALLLFFRSCCSQSVLVENRNHQWHDGQVSLVLPDCINERVSTNMRESQHEMFRCFIAWPPLCLEGSVKCDSMIMRFNLFKLTQIKH